MQKKELSTTKAPDSCCHACLMATEAHHRIKNTLHALLVYLRKIRAQKDTPVADIDKVIGFLQGYTTLHEILMKRALSDEEKVYENVFSPIHTLIDLLAEIREERIELSVEHIFLPVHQCGIITMIINELVHNAFTHGKSPIFVSLKKTKNSFISLEVSDSGKGFTEDILSSSSKRTGIFLVQRLVSSELEGNIVFHKNKHDKGAKISIRFQAEQR